MDYKYGKFKHKQRATCTIEGERITDARISINPDGKVFICQNKMDGRMAEDNFGYKYSWYFLLNGEDFEEGEAGVENLKLSPKGGRLPKYKPPIAVVIYDEEDEDPIREFQTKADLNKWLKGAVADSDITNIRVLMVSEELRPDTTVKLVPYRGE